MRLPERSQRFEAGDVSIAQTGPAAWLAIKRDGGNGFAASLKSTLAGNASVSDQSDAYVVHTIAGLKVRSALEKVVPIDMHGRVFPVGRVARTVAAQVSIVLWLLPDDSGSPAFGIAVPRSLAGSFWDALVCSAREFGLVRPSQLGAPPLW
jgi:heterotetrameric sarcosine oxidase gamma subunit